MIRFLLPALLATAPLSPAASPADEGPGADEVNYKVDATPEALTVTASGKDLDLLSFVVALGAPDFSGSPVVPYKK